MMRSRSARTLAGFGLISLTLAPIGCFEDPPQSSDDEVGDGDGDPGDGDGDGEPGDGDGEPGDGDGEPGDGDGEPGDGDGDGDGEPGDGDGEPGDGDGEPDGWQARRQLTFVNTILDDGLTEFPLLVRLNPSRIEYAIMHSDGRDLRFYDRNENPLAYEIERWSPGGESFVWVRVPEIDANDDHIFMDYGNLAADSAQDPPAVWADHYLGVWHLADDPASGVAHDSTGQFDGTLSVGNDITSVMGAVGPGLVFDGDDRIEIPYDPAFDLTESVTVEGWANPVAAASSYRHILEKGGGNSPYTLQVSICCTQISGLTIRNAGIGGNASVPHIATGEWTYLVGAWTNTNDSARLHVDGVQAATGDVTGPMKVNAMPLGIGTNVVGSLDEVRLAAQAHSGVWIAAQHASMTDQLLTFGAPTSP